MLRTITATIQVDDSQFRGDFSRFLKRLGRAYNIRVTDMRELKGEQQKPEQPGGQHEGAKTRGGMWRG